MGLYFQLRNKTDECVSMTTLLLPQHRDGGPYIYET